ncbi:MAG: hypothetical protein MI975_01945 [Cytophagales bacterium]|nr:hypothetical protein [Cytophagales bacterium]
MFTNDEAEEFCLVPIWICILIASADEKIDHSEVKKALKIAREKRARANEQIIDYYKKVAEKFEVNLKGYLTLLPTDHNKRVDFLVERLERVNYFFSKMEKEVAYQLYLSFRDMANKIARASGGIFGLLSVSFAESKYIDLKMISNPNEIQV